jgi:diguanylate cyclase (GGDEF)-like protein
MTEQTPDEQDPDLITLIEDGDDGPPAEGGAEARRWKVLIVDDDEDVHCATTLALQGLTIEGRRLALLHAHSAAEARAVLAGEPDIAVAFLDVVMETPDAGLRLVRQLREELQRQALRVVLRTGQPGYAPELETIRDCDINDYRTKSELTQVRLYTTLTGAVRSYRQLVALQDARRSLELVVRANAQQGSEQGLDAFAHELMVLLCQLLEVPVRGIAALCEHGQARVVAASDASLRGLAPDVLPHTPLLQAMQQSRAARESRFEPLVSLYLPGADGEGLVLAVDGVPRSDLQRHLVDVFAASVAAGFRNVRLLARLADLAYLDPLLGLPNRNRFVALIDERRARSTGAVMALLDIDDFSGVNQMLGHDVGDDLLKAVASRLAGVVGEDSVLARVAGDVFGLLGPASRVGPAQLAQAMALPFEVQGESLRLTATSGLVQLDAGEKRGIDLLKDAHIALKRAKFHQRGAAEFFSEALGTGARERMRLLRGLREAFEHHHLYVAYQPQVDLADGRVVGAEALLRWRTDDGRHVPPDRFIPIAEQSGLIVAIGEFVLRTACQQLKRLHDLGHTGLCMAVNVSQAQFRSPAFVPSLSQALADSHVDPACVELEITESMAADDLDTVLCLLAAIRATGVGVAIDDFGTGFSSLSVLRQLQVDKLKIDRSFVNDVGPDPQPGSVARMVIELGRNLGMRVIAEGVETAAQRDALLGMGCHQGQGWLFSPALQAAELEAWLAKKGEEG